MAEPKIIPCKEKDCDKTVTYERTVVRGFRTTRRGAQTVVVYLTCPNKHTHKYEFPVSS